jgi:histidinol-phosphate aminotransferase
VTWQDKVRRVTPYTAGEQPKDKTLIKLNTNECPYPPSPSVKIVLEEVAQRADQMRLYPDMDATPIVAELARAYKVRPEQIFVGVGSDDVLSMSFLTFFTNGKKVLFPDITYSFYDVWADLYRIDYTAVPLRDDFTINPDNYIPGSKDFAAPGQELGGIIFPNPNAPTGVELPLAEIERIVAGNPDCVVIVDEAYVDFGAKSAKELLTKYKNLLIVQTFSKSRALAGIRIGFAIGNEELIGYLKDVKFSFNSYTMNLPALAVGAAAARDVDYFHYLTGRIVETREWFKGELKRLGFSFPESKTNFVFITHEKIHAKELFKKLRENRVIVRYFDKPRINEYLRVTIGTKPQMEEVVRVLEKILQETDR